MLAAMLPTRRIGVTFSNSVAAAFTGSFGASVEDMVGSSCGIACLAWKTEKIVRLTCLLATPFYVPPPYVHWSMIAGSQDARGVSVSRGRPMMPVVMPKTDAARVAALQKYEILDTDPEQSFDDLTLLASFIC